MNLRCLFGHAWRAIHAHYYHNVRRNKDGTVVHDMPGTVATYRCTRCDKLRTEDMKDAGHIPLSAFLPNTIDVDAVTEAALRKMKEKS